MSVSEFLAESKRIEGDWLAPKSGESTVEFMAWATHAMEALPRMREALEAVLAIHERGTVEIVGFNATAIRTTCLHCSGLTAGEKTARPDEVFVYPCPTVRAIESALAENGGKK